MAKRKWLPLIMAAVLMILGGTGIVQAYTISYDISDDYIMAGESFDIDVSISDIASDDFFGYDPFLGFELNFDKSFSLMSYNGYTLSGIYSDNSSASNSIKGFYQPLVYFENYLLTTFHFTAGDILGVETIDFTGSASFLTGDVSLSKELNIAVVPEPGTIILMASGLLGLGLFHRRRKGTKK